MFVYDVKSGRALNVKAGSLKEQGEVVANYSAYFLNGLDPDMRRQVLLLIDEDAKFLSRAVPVGPSMSRLTRYAAH